MSRYPSLDDVVLQTQTAWTVLANTRAYKIESQRTWRFGIHIGGDCALLSLSIKEARSDIASSTHSTLSGVLDRGGLSGIGPSHSSVRMLSSERRLSPEEGALIGVGSVNSSSDSGS